jgi:hypothetical protein
MCRTGGRRCPGSGGRGQGDREAYEERAAEFRSRVAAGESPTDVMAAKHEETSRVLIERAIQLDAEDGVGQWPSSSS